MGKEISKEQKTVYNLYALFGVSLVLSVIPNMSAAILCAIFFTWVLIAAYMVRKKASEHSLTENHAIYIIRSLWIGAFISCLTMGLASFYLLQNLDYAPFQSCADALLGKGLATLETMGITQIHDLIEPCVDGFIHHNHNALIAAMGIGAAPPLVYMGYRFICGISRAIKGYRLADPKRWF